MKDIKKLILTLVALLAVTTGAYAASVSYIDGNGTSQTVDATELESTTTSWTDGSWYIVPEGGLTISGRIAVSGTVNLILRDGTELTASAGITTTGATLNIYAQSTGTGALTATGNNGGDPNGGGSAGIGGNGVARIVSGGAGGTVNIYGGTVTATGGNGAQYGGGGAGIGGGGLGYDSSGGQGGTVNIYGGTVTATGGTGGELGGGGAGIGGGGNGFSESTGGQGGTVNICGGTVTATGGNGTQDAGGGAGIGGGGYGFTTSTPADGTLTLGVGVKLYNGTDNTGTVLDNNDSESRNYSGSRPQNMFAEGTVAASASTGPEVDGPTIVDGKPQWTFTMPGGNVTLEPDYYPQATAAEGAVTAATDAKATTDAPLVTIDETKLTGAKKLMYYVSTDATAPAYDAQGWTDVLPTAENYTEAATLYVWYYPVGTDEDDDEATATYSDGDICSTALTVTLGAAPTYAVTLNAEGLSTDEAAAWKVAKGTDQPAAFPLEGVTKGQPVTVTYSGTKKVIGVKAEKKAAATTPTLAEATAEDCGKVVCADGHLHDAKTAVPDGCTAVGILGKVTETGHGLILALKDATQQEWNTINGWTSVTTYAGTTLKVLPDDAARGTNLASYSTLGETAVSNWAVAQKSDYEAIFTNLGSTKGDSDGNTYDANVNAYITTGVGGTAISGRYWSATERDGDNAWDFHSNCWAGNGKTSNYILRPVLGF